MFTLAHLFYVLFALGSIRLLTILYYFFMISSSTIQVLLLIIFSLLMWFLIVPIARILVHLYFPRRTNPRDRPVYRQFQDSVSGLCKSLVAHREHLSMVSPFFGNEAWFRNQNTRLARIARDFDIAINDWRVLKFTPENVLAAQTLVALVTDMLSVMRLELGERIEERRRRVELHYIALMAVNGTWELVFLFGGRLDLAEEERQRVSRQGRTVRRRFAALYKEIRTAPAVERLEKRVEEFVREVKTFTKEVERLLAGVAESV